MKIARSDIVVLVVLVVVVSIVVVFVSRGGQKAPAPEPLPTTSQSTATTDAVGASTESLLTERAEQVIRVYAAFPNKAGTQKVLTQLQPLIDEPAFQSVKNQWQGPEVTTASIAVTNLKVLSMRYLDSTRTQVITQVLVTQAVTFAYTPPESRNVTVNVLFKQVGGAWHITGLSFSGEGHG